MDKSKKYILTQSIDYSAMDTNSEYVKELLEDELLKLRIENGFRGRSKNEGTSKVINSPQ